MKDQQKDYFQKQSDWGNFLVVDQDYISTPLRILII